MNLRITGGSIISPKGPVPMDIKVRDGLIDALVPPGELGPHDPDETEFDAAGLWLLPGAVDAHTHCGMPLKSGITSLGWRESSEAALLGGTTMVIDFANPDRGEPLQAAVQRWQAAADDACLCDYGLHCTVPDTSSELLAEIPALVEQGIPTFKGFLAYKGRLMLTPQEMKTLMAAVHAAGGMVLVHAENGEFNDAAQQTLINTGRTTPNWHPQAHPAASEVSAVRLALDLAGKTGCPMTIVHMSLSDSLAALKQAKAAEGAAALFGEVCLHHLAANESWYEMGHEKALAALCSPPLRAITDTTALLAGLIAGSLDWLATDHCEFALATKIQAASAGFPAVPNGCGGVGERLTLSYSLAVATGAMTPWRWQEVCCARPAEIMGCGDRKGRLRPGWDADIVAFDPKQEHLWEPLGRSDHAGSLYKGRPVTGQVRHVWRSGLPVVMGGLLVAQEQPGRFVKRRVARPH